MTRNQTPLLSSQGAILIPALPIIPACSLYTLAEGSSYNKSHALFFSGTAERQTPTSGIPCRERHGYGELELMGMERLPGPFLYSLMHPGAIASVSAVPIHTPCAPEMPAARPELHRGEPRRVLSD